MTSRADQLIAALGLQPHPEGGHYGEVYRSSALVHPGDGRGTRAALTTIYFLLTASEVSRWHRVQSDEVWHSYEGAPLRHWMADAAGHSIGCVELGALDRIRRPVRAVPAGFWQAARSSGEYTLVGCTVGPGFDFNDFSFAADCPPIAELLRQQSPEVAELL